MYYDEKWINGELHWKSSPNGKWKPFTKEGYRNRVKELEAKLNTIYNTVNT